MKYKYGIIIPTVAITENFVPFFDNFLNTISDNTQIILSVNSLNAQQGKVTIQAAGLAFKKFQIVSNYKNIDLQILESEVPVGWCVANNVAYSFLKKEGLPEYVVFMNDDVRLSFGWQVALSNAIESKKLNEETALNGFKVNTFDVEDFGTRTGAAAPSCNNAAASSNIVRLLGEEANKFKALPFETQADFAAQTYKDVAPIPTNLASGVLLMFKKECLLDLEYEEGKIYHEALNNGGFDDNDLCARLTSKKWHIVVDFKTFMHHDQSKTCSMKEFSSLNMNTKNWCKFLLMHEEETQRKKIITALYRVKLSSIQDYLYLRSSLHRAGQLVDKISFLATNDFSEIINHPEYMKEQFKISQKERDFFRTLSPDNCAEKLIDLIEEISTIPKENIYFDVWNSAFNERDERNKCIENARKMGTDFMFSIDSDEVVEERFTKELLKKIINHPNPNIIGYLITWRNHWESPSIVNSTYPIGDEGTLTGGMLGIRIWKDIGQNIVMGNELGLHCGNAPPISETSVVHVNLSMRHFSLLRKKDREFKFYNYNRLDPNPDFASGRGYNHLVKSDGVQVSEYNSRTGIVCNMLFYEKESKYDLFAWLSNLHSIVDDMNITWTSKWEEEDKAWQDFLSVEDWPSQANWYKTGPDFETAHLCRLFGIEIVHLEKTNEVGFSDLRNYGLDKLRERKTHFTRWATFFDPDEIPLGKTIDFQRAITACSHRNKEFGFLFKFSNYNSKGNTAYSETIRMFNIDLKEVRFKGKIHESLSQSIESLINQGLGIALKYFPVTMLNKGLILSEEEATIKFNNYLNLTLSELEKDPKSCIGWHTLAMQLHDAKQYDKFIIAIERALLCAGSKYLPFETLGGYYLRLANTLYKNAIKRIDREHPKSSHFMKIAKFLEEHGPSIMDVPCDKETLVVELPDFPYDIIDDVSKWGNLITHVHTNSRS